MDPKHLYDFGLTDAEARVYLALLSIGRAKSGSIVKATGLQSSTVYNALPSLSLKGLVSHVYLGKTKQYSAEPPESFLFYLEERRRKFSEVLPKLKKMEAAGKQEQKSARALEGMKGFRAAVNDVYMTMKPGEEYYFFQVETENLMKKRVRLFFRNWHLRRSAKGILVKGLAPEAAREPMKWIYGGVKHTKVRYVKDFLPTGTVVYKNKVILMDIGDQPAVFVIQCQAIADSFRRFFETKWKGAKP
jgi:sugar-specific transcriptional regulator TrmB